MLRLFTALSLPEILRQRIHLMQGGVPGARWTALENYHVTLTFIGEADEAAAEDIDEALASVHAASFNLSLKGTGNFSQGEWPKVLWLGVDAPAALPQLKEKIDRALDLRGIDFEKRKYSPHVTMARLKNADEGKLAEFMQANNLFASESFRAENFILYNSISTKNGAVYEPLRSYPLS